MEQLRAELARPLKLPSPQELGEDRILGLNALHDARGDDVAPAREQLRALLDRESILLHPSTRTRGGPISSPKGRPCL